MGAGVIGTYLGVVTVVLRSWCVVMCTVSFTGHNTTCGSETTLYIRTPEDGHVNVGNM